MKYCVHCGNALVDEAVICVKCGCSADSSSQNLGSTISGVIQQLSDRLRINGIIWLVVGILQILVGIYLNIFVLVVGIINIITAIGDLNYCKNVLTNPIGIVDKFKPLAGAIITLIYNVIFGGIIGVAGSVYYLIAVRGFVMNNENSFTNE